MQYETLAAALLQNRAKLLRIPVARQISQMATGESFVLDYLAAAQNGVHPNSISREMTVSTARIAAILNHLEDKGLITRTADPMDNRQTIVRLTEAGHAYIAEKRSLLLVQVAEMLRALGPEDALAYTRIQEKIIRQISRPQVAQP